VKLEELVKKWSDGEYRIEVLPTLKREGKVTHFSIEVAAGARERAFVVGEDLLNRSKQVIKVAEGSTPFLRSFDCALADSELFDYDNLVAAIEQRGVKAVAEHLLNL